MLTKYRRLFLAEVVQGQVKQGSHLLSQQRNKRLVVLAADQTVREHPEALVDPKPGHPLLGIVKFFVGT